MVTTSTKTLPRRDSARPAAALFRRAVCLHGRKRGCARLRKRIDVPQNGRRARHHEDKGCSGRKGQKQSTLSVGRTLASIGIPRSTFYDWYGRYQDGGIEALEDGKPRPQRVWNKIPDEIGAAIVNLALDEPDLSPRELAVNFTDTKASFVSKPAFIGF